MNWLLQLLNPSRALLSAKPAPAIITATTSVAPTQPEESAPRGSLRNARLIMVSSDNNNKFYEMRELENGTFVVSYGRVGSKGAEATYTIDQWQTKYNEKIRKGYRDQTYLYAKETLSDPFEGIAEPAVRDLISHLMRYAKQSIHHHYTIAADQVTRAHVEEAQTLLDRLAALIQPGMDADTFNLLLLELFQVIPRRMRKVGEHLLSASPDTEEELKAVEQQLAAEQAMLDVMRGQVEINAKQEQNQTKETTLLESLGLQIEPVKEDQIIRQIQKMMGDDKDKFRRAYEVSNRFTQSKFERHVSQCKNKKVELFWHGSRNENWMSILKSGLVLRPANAVITGKMFGYGLYFADRFRKSLNYSSLQGACWTNGREQRAYLALYEVHLGNSLKVQRYEPWCSELSAEKLEQRGAYQSLYARGGADLVNNEYIVYHESQCTIRYLVEVANA